MPDMTDAEWQQQLDEERRLSMEGARYRGPIAADAPAPPQEADNPPPEVPPQTAEPAAAYQGQAYPGMPIIGEGGRFYAGGNNGYGGQGGNAFDTEEQAMASRAQDAATNVPAQEAFRRQAEQRAAAGTEGGPSEPTSIQIRAEMNQHQLSPADRLELTQMQNGISRLQRDAREGRVPALQAAQLEADLRRRMAPKLYSMQQLQGMTAALHVADLREQVMHRTIANQRARAYDAAHGLEAQSTVAGPDGRPLGVMVRNPDGSSHPFAIPDNTVRDAHIAENERAARERVIQRSNERFDTALATETHRLETRRADVTSPPEIRNMTDDALSALARTRARAVHNAWSQLPGNSLLAGQPATGTATPVTSQGRGGATTPASTATGATATAAPSTPGTQTPEQIVEAARVAQQPLPAFSLRTQNEPIADLPAARVRTVEGIVNAITPTRTSGPSSRDDQTRLAHSPLDLSSGTEVALAQQMRGILQTASRENRTLTNREGTEYENARLELNKVNPDAARLYNLVHQNEQDAFGHTPERASQLQTLVPLLRDESARIYNGMGNVERNLATGFGQYIPWLRHGGNQAAPLVGSMHEILRVAADNNRRLNATETAHYLSEWRRLRRVDSNLADRLALHQQ